MKRALSIILSLALVLSLLPLNLTTVSAEQEAGAETSVVGTTEAAKQEPAKVPVRGVETHSHASYACDCAEGEQWQAWANTNTLPAESGYYYLTNNVTLTDVAQMSNASVVLCLNGKTVTAKSSKRVYRLGGGASLTICDCTAATVDGTYTAGKLVGGALEGGCVWANKGNTVTIYDGIFTNATNSAILASSDDKNAPTTITMKGGLITGNATTNYAGAAVHVHDIYTTFKMEGGTITNNTAASTSTTKVDGKNGGAIGDKGTIEITGGTISNNTASNMGGAIYATGTLTLKNATVSGNKSGDTGGGIYANGTLGIEGATVSGNESGSTGGGIHADSSSSATIKNSYIKNNKTTGNSGGGIRAAGTKMEITGGEISGNISAASGGGIFSSSGKPLTIKNATVSGNTAYDTGGGIQALGTTTIENTQIINNTAENKGSTNGGGGGIYIVSVVTLKGCTVTGNKAGKLGGGIELHSASNSLTLDGKTVITGNTVGAAASNLYLKKNAKIVLSSLTNGSEICVTAADAANARVLAENVASDVTAYFRYDTADYSIGMNGTSLVLGAPVSSVALNKDELALVAGGNETLTVAVLPDGAVNKGVAWASDNESVATVDQTGKVTAVANGTATITATAKDGSGKSASCTVTVTTLPGGISLNKTTLVLTVGTTSKLTASVLPDTASNKGVTWSSSKENIVSVDQSGNLTALAVGAAKITVAAQADPSITKNCDVTVVEKHLHTDYACDCGEGEQWQLWTNTNALPTASGYYYLYKDVTLTSDMTTLENANVVLCLNGKTVKAKSGGRVYKLNGGASLTICDCTAATVDGTYTAGKLVGNSTQGGCIWANKGNNFTLYDGILTGATDSAIFAWSDDSNAVTTVTMKGGWITENSAKTGASVYLNENNPYTIFRMEGGTISKNTASKNGGAIGGKGTIEITGGTIRENTAGTTGGAISVSGGAQVTISGATLERNKAANGGAIYQEGASTRVTIGGGAVITANEASKNGGAIYAANGSVTLGKAMVSKNKATGNGGGAYLANAAQLTLSDADSLISENEAGTGAGVCLASDETCTAKLVMQNGKITKNTSVNAGGGIRLDGKKTVAEITGGEISSNKAGTSGGAIFNNGTLTVKNATVSGNTAVKTGGGIQSQGVGLTLENATLQNNEATENGGAVRTNAALTMTGCTVKGNKALNGGALYATGDVTLTIEDTDLSSNHAAAQGGALWVTGATVTLKNCTVSGNDSVKEVGAIYGQGKAKLTIDGSTITKNTCGAAGYGAIAVPNSNSTITLKGKAVIKDNVTADGAAQNLVIRDDGGATVGTAELSAESEIHFTLTNFAAGKVISTDAGETDVSASFVSDRWGYAVEKQENKLVLVFDASLKHTHDDVDWTPWLEKDSLPKEGGHYVLVFDIELTEVQAYKQSKDVYLCLNGHSITQTGENVRLLRISDGAKVTVCDCTGEGVLTGGNLPDDATTGSGGAVYVAGEGSAFTLLSGSISGNTAGRHGGAIVCLNGAELFVKGGKITGNTAGYNAGALYVSGGKLHMTGGEISENSAGKLAGGIYLAAAKTGDALGEMTGGSVKKNQSLDGDGAGMYLSAGSFTIGGTAAIEENRSAAAAGGVNVRAAATLNLTGGSVSNNTAKNGAGIVVTSNSRLEMSGGTVSGNEAVGDSGGGIFVNTGCDIAMSGGKVSGNTVLNNGAGIYLGGNGTFTGGEISGNMAGGQGGGIYVAGGNAMTLDGVNILNNQAASAGGVLARGKAEVTFVSGSVSGNTADGHGGGFLVQSYAVLNMTGGTIKDNTAANTGGGIRTTDNTISITGGEISGNMAGGQGGGIYTQAVDSVIRGVKFENNTANATSSSYKSYGGAVLLGTNASVTLEDCTFTGNTAYGSGAAVGFWHTRYSAVKNCDFGNNTSHSFGGAIYVSSSANASLSDNEIHDNTATTRGGAILVDASGTLVSSGNRFTGNTSANGAALYIQEGGSASLSGETISGNNAKLASAIYSSGTLELLDVQITDNKATDNTAVYLDGMPNDDLTMNTTTKFGGDVIIRDNDGGDAYITNKGVIFIADEGLGAKAEIALRLESGLVSDMVFGSYDYEKLEECSYLITAGTRSMTEPEGATATPTEPQPTEEGSSNVLLYAAIGGGALLAAALTTIIVVLRKKRNAHNG